MQTLHKLAILMGWYRNITTGLPLNVCKTIFGTHFLEGVYTMEPVGKLMQDFYQWGLHDPDNEAVVKKLSADLARAKTERDTLRERLVKMTQAVPGPWKINKSKTKRYRVWEYPRSRSVWRTESEPIEPANGQIKGTDTVVMDMDWRTLEEEFNAASE
jgi:hypothetical protein